MVIELLRNKIQFLKTITSLRDELITSKILKNQKFLVTDNLIF